MELELKHLAAYLPFGITLHYMVRNQVAGCGKLKAIIHDEYATHPTKVKIESGEYEHIWMFKPVLKSMNHLTRKELEDAGFATHIDFLTKELYSESTKNRLDHKGKPLWRIGKVPYEMIDYLLSRHYDIFDLISKGLAVER